MSPMLVIVNMFVLKSVALLGGVFCVCVCVCVCVCPHVGVLKTRWMCRRERCGRISFGNRNR